MRIVEIKTQTAKIIYKPAVEQLKVGDFVNLKEGENVLIGQVFKIVASSVADEFNQADLYFALSYKYDKINKWQGEYISLNALVEKTPYEVIQNYINPPQNKKKLVLGSFLEYPQQFLSVDFKKLNTPAFIGFEKQEDNKKILLSLAKQFDAINQKFLIFDFKGNLEIPNASIITAGQQAKLPLNFKILSDIRDKILLGISVESKAIIENILDDILLYAKETKFISISHLVKVIDDIYKQTKISQLLLFKNKLQYYKKLNLFADNSSEINAVFNAFEQSNVVIFDLSEVSLEWHKDFLFDIISRKNENIHFHITLDEMNSDNTIINQLLFKTTNNGLYPIISSHYRYLAFDNIFEFAQNLILFKTHNSLKKYPILSDIIQTLPEEGFVLNGKLSNNLLLCLSLYDATKTVQLNILKQENKESFSAEKQNFASEDAIEQIHTDKCITSDIDLLNGALSQEKEILTFEQIPQQEIQQPNLNKDELAIENNIDQIFSADTTPDKNESIQEFEESNDVLETEENVELDEIEDIQELEKNNDILDTKENVELDEIESIQEFEENNDVLDTEENVNIDEIDDSFFDEANVDEALDNIEEIENLDVDDLDFLTESGEETTNNNNDDDLLDLIPDFDENNPGEQLNEMSIDVVEQNYAPKEEIPIYDANYEDTSNSSSDIKEGDLIKHNKYGIGTVKKITKHGEKKLCHINFDNIGRRLLDPDISDIEKIQ